MKNGTLQTVAMSDDERRQAAADRIRQRWATVQNISEETVSVIRLPGGGGPNMYSGSSLTNTSNDFLGDWRAVDTWMRFDLYRVRCRSRQLQRGNPLCINYGRAMRNNVLGCKGFHRKIVAKTGKRYGDATDDVLDEAANLQIRDVIDEMGKAKNFETRKRLSERDADRLLLTKLIFDGEIIIRKRRGFANDFGFAWQIIDPDYLDQNLNRVETGYDQDGRRVAEPGNITKMGVELDKDDKFPVAYWFLHRRPNDYLYNYATIASQRYFRVPAEEIFHIFVQSDDSEQTRGWPWIFAGMLNLFRMEKFQEAALINAAIGASKPFFYTKDYPVGWTAEDGDLDDQGQMIDKVAPGVAVELPYGVKPADVNTRYPDAELQPFLEAMSLGMGLTFGTSYATTTGDMSKANFVSSRLGQLEEREFYMSIQDFLIERWKEPAYDEQLYRAMLARKVTLPISKFDKFNAAAFTGRRWAFVQPVDENRAMEIALNNRVTSISAEIEKQGGDADEVFQQIARDEERLKELGIPRITGSGQNPDDGKDDGGAAMDKEHEVLKGHLADAKDINADLAEIQTELGDE